MNKFLLLPTRRSFDSQGVLLFSSLTLCLLLIDIVLHLIRYFLLLDVTRNIHPLNLRVVTKHTYSHTPLRWSQDLIFLPLTLDHSIVHQHVWQSFKVT